VKNGISIGTGANVAKVKARATAAVAAIAIAAANVVADTASSIAAIRPKPNRLPNWKSTWQN
jgi:hypothetical protein